MHSLGCVQDLGRGTNVSQNDRKALFSADDVEYGPVIEFLSV